MALEALKRTEGAMDGAQPSDAKRSHSRALGVERRAECGGECVLSGFAGG